MHRCRVLRSAVAVFLLGVVALQAQPVTVAQETTPSADMSEELVDLAWLAPGPADLDEDGYGLSYAAYQPAAEGGVSVYGIPGPLAPYDEAFSIAGARQTYYQQMSSPDEDDPDVVARMLSVVIGEFANDDGAVSGFSGVVDVFAEDHDQSRTPPKVGEEALAFRGEFKDPADGRIYQELRILFRTGRFLADLSIADYLGDAPATSELTPVAQLLAERLAEAEATESPGLALQVVRITSPELTYYYDHYRLRGGERVRDAGELTSRMQAGNEFFEEIGATDQYSYMAEVLPTEDDESYVSLSVGILHFTDRRTAETYLETAVDDWIEWWGAYYQDIEIIADAEEVGDDSAAASFTQETTFGELANGYLFWVRAGDRVAAVELAGIPEITLPVAQQIAEAQLACFDDQTCLEPIPVSELR
jgi:hypothetical protein